MRYGYWLKLGLTALLLITASLGLVLTATNQTSIPAAVFAQAVPPANSALTATAYISGAVNSPGMYEIDAATTVADLVTRAGGFRADADGNFVSGQLNLAAIVTDHQHLDIPTAKAETTNTISGSAPSSGKINLNTASESDLESLPGIGPSLAASIIAARPFKTLTDVNNVKGIGDAKFQQIQALVTI